MTRSRSIFTLALCLLAVSGPLFAQQLKPQQEQVQNWEIVPLTTNGWVEYDLKTDLAEATNGVRIIYGDAVLTAEKAQVSQSSGEVIAEGNVRIQQAEQLWIGQHMVFNFKTKQMEAQEFRTGKTPIFVAGEGLHGELTNNVYIATNAIITTDDVAKPAVRIRAKYIKIIPGKRLVARDGLLFIGPLPVFYFPYYTRDLTTANNFNFIPGYRSSYGPFVLSSYHWVLNPQLDGTVHLDYRERRGPGVGPDFNYHLGKWGEGSFKYYYIHDDDPNASLTNALPHNRERLYFSYLGEPLHDLSIRSQVRYQGDLGIIHDFFESEYRLNPQPSTFVEAEKVWKNFGLDLYVQPRVNDFLDTIERLPDLRLTGYRQQLWNTPLYYESESSAGYYRHLFAETNSFASTNNYEAARADTYHQITLPETFFGWLNFTPRVGGRYTYYGEATGPGATTGDLSRGVFNTGAELTFKASRVWPEFHSSLLDADGLRHIIQPSVNYVFVPRPNAHGTNEIPQFDYELPSLRLLPIEFPDYNAIDSIDSRNVIRLGLNNKFQTKRNGQIVNLANWDLYTDWRLQPRRNQSTFADLYSDLSFRPRSWITFDSLTRYDIADGQWRMAFHTITLAPNDVWSISLGHFYLRDDPSLAPTSLGEGNNLFSSSIYYRLNENWAFRAAHRYEARDGRLQEQDYSIYRDMRSWTAALTFRVRQNTTGPDDVAVALTFSFKAFPRYSLGSDIAKPYLLLGN
jgi:lipopolysaccharide assembly outer membrane protein LptD (OstA)